MLGALHLIFLLFVELNLELFHRICLLFKCLNITSFNQIQYWLRIGGLFYILHWIIFRGNEMFSHQLFIFLLGHILFMPEWLQLFVLFPNLNNFLFVFMLEKIRDNVNFHWCVATSETALEDYFSCSGLLKLFIEFENLICKVRYSNWTDYLIIFHKCIYCQSSVNNLLWEQTIRRVLYYVACHSCLSSWI